MKDEVIILYRDYSSGKMKLKDIPLEKLNKMILIKASVLEPENLSDVILELYRNNMFASINLNLTVALAIIQEEYKNQRFYDKLFMINPFEIFSRVPREYRTEDMCNKLLLFDPSFDNFELIPIQFRTNLMWKKMMINSNSIDLFKDIPIENMDQELCNIVFDKFGISSFEYIPNKYKTQEMCEKVSKNTSSWKVFFMMPKKLLTQDICHNIFFRSVIEGELLECFQNIPLEYRSISMCKKMIDYCNDSDVLKLIPKKQLTKIICDMALNKYSDEALENIPEELKTREFYIDLLERDFSKYLKYVPNKYYDLELYAIIALELRKLKKQNKTIEMDRTLSLEIIKIYPELIKVLSDEMREEIITGELISLISNGGTLSYISRKYKLSIEDINDILEKMKETNIEEYNSIKNVLYENQQRYYLTMLEDIEYLYNIVLLIDDSENVTFDVQQKIMFAYLYGKCVFNSLEEIYEYNIKTNFLNHENLSEKDRSLYSMMSIRIVSFLKKYFKYNYALGDGVTNIDMVERKNILLNTGWVKKYKRENYIKIENGIYTITRKYGKNEEPLTLEIEEYIVSRLKQSNIPLIDIIVSTAFRKYFDNKLDEYIVQLDDYEICVDDIKNNKNNKKK